MKTQFFEKGWCRFSHDQRLSEWIKSVLPRARELVADDSNSQWLRCGGTWFAGVNLLPNRSDGSVDDSPELSGDAIDFIEQSLGLKDFDWDRGQLSICYPGYPQPMPGETEAAYAYRRNHDGAHVDGLLPEGPQRRRHLREQHDFILGIPMVEFTTDASPFVVWEASHELVRETFKRVYRGIDVAQWGDVDVTDDYHRLRRRIFNECKRVEIHAAPGEAYLVHRLALHGVAAWKNGAIATRDGRMICYFRPGTGGASRWLFGP